MIQIFLVEGHTKVVQEVLAELKGDCTDSRTSQKMVFVAKNRYKEPGDSHNSRTRDASAELD